MKNKTLYKIGVLISELEALIIRYLLILNTLMFLMFFLPFTSLKSLDGEFLNLFESVGKFFFLISNVNWYSFYSVLLYPILLIQPFLFGIAIIIIYSKDKKYTKSFFVNSVLSENEKIKTLDNNDINKSTSITLGIPLFILIFQIIFYISIGIAFGLWIIFFFYYQIKDVNVTVLPNASILMSAILIFVVLLKLRINILRKYNQKLFLHLVLELTSDIIVENITLEIKNTNEYKYLKLISKTLDDFLGQTWIFLQKIEFIVSQPNYIQPTLIRNFSILEQAFPEFIIAYDILKKKEIGIYPLSIIYQGYKIEKNKIIESGHLKINESINKTFTLSGKKEDEIGIELFSTSTWLNYPKNVKDTFEMHFDSQKTKYLKSGQRDLGNLHVIQYDKNDNIYTQNFTTRIHLEPNSKSVERYSNFTSFVTILGFIFWYNSAFPLFLSYTKPMNFSHNNLLVISFWIVYFLFFNLALHGSKKYFSRNSTSILKSILFGIIISFGATALNSYTKSKFGFFPQDLQSGFVKSIKNVNIRAEATKNSNVIYKVKAGEKLKIEAKDGEWYRVYYGLDLTSIGYIHSDFLKIDSTKEISSKPKL